MRIYAIIFAVISLAFLLAPTAAVRREKSKEPDAEVQTSSEASAAGVEGEVIKVLRSADKSVETLSREEYLIGALAAEMSPSYHEEALKAQAIAAYTYALYNKLAQESAPTLSLKGAHLSDSPLTHQGYLSPEQRTEKWGDKTKEYEQRIKKAVTAVSGKALTYDGEYIIAAFHSICPGRTEDAKAVWGEEIPYLKSVVSDGDRLSPNYTDTLVLTAEQFSGLFSQLEDVSFGDDVSKWVGKAQRTECGTVLEITVGGVKLTGAKLRSTLGLRSSAFTIDCSDECFTVKTTGYGHFVGMSQYGARAMAENGDDYVAILLHYYKGCEIENIAKIKH